jgi:hypothetical protein
MEDNDGLAATREKQRNRRFLQQVKAPDLFIVGQGLSLYVYIERARHLVDELRPLHPKLERRFDESAECPKCE